MATSAPAKRPKHFSAEILTALHKGKSLRIRAGTGDHRFIGIWVVVVRDRVFVRSWSVKPEGWYRTFLAESRGTVLIKDRDIVVRAAPIRDKRVLDAIDSAYQEKYNTPGAIKYARDLGSAQSRAATLELTPLPPARKT
jgi:hypothetical protein